MELIQKFISKQKKAQFSPEEVNDLVIKARKGNINARNALVEFNMRYVVYTAFKYRNIIEMYPRIEMSDLVSEGVFGLVRAIELFDVTKGFAFSTYAHSWINQSIGRYIDNFKNMVRVPVYALSIQKQFQKLKSEFTDKEEDFYIKLLAFENGVSELSIRNSLRFRGDGVVSIHAKIDEEGELREMELEDLIQNDPTTLIDAFHIQKMAGLLGERDKKIIMLRMENYSLWAIAEMVGLSRERVRQIEVSALIRLRAMVNTNKGV